MSGIFNKISYYDLKHEAKHGRLKNIVGRLEEIERLNRLTSRANGNCAIVGESGSGKTALLHGFALGIAKQKKSINLIQLFTENLFALSSGTIDFQKYLEAFKSLPECILFFDDFGELVYNKPQILQSILSLFKNGINMQKVKLILTLKPHEQKWLETESPAFFSEFEIVQVKNQSENEQLQILKLFLKEKKNNITISEEVLQSIIKYANRFSSLGYMPSAGILVLEEAVILAQSKKANVLLEDHVASVVAEKIGIPVSQLKTSELEMLKTLKNKLLNRVIGQTHAIEKITSVIQRSKLGLRSNTRPLGSFLLLGPSGVGKTETAKTLADLVFGRKESFIRIDMSEFGQEHTVQRLLGAPAGYVGYEEGGGLTEPVKKEPYSLILLDELEKAHNKVFDIFLQVLDDGRLTSGKGETVDFTQTIVMATSNMAVEEILQGYADNLDVHGEEFLKKVIMPALTKKLRPEFINRFDHVIIFKPLAVSDLLEIAKKEILAIEERVKKHKIKFAIEDKVLTEKIAALQNNSFGARPVKRFIEETCESLIVQKLLNSSEQNTK